MGEFGIGQAVKRFEDGRLLRGQGRFHEDVNLAGQIRPVQVEDVLGREPVEVDLEASASYVRGRAVRVTGAGSTGQMRPGRHR